MNVRRHSLRQSLPSLHSLVLFEASARHLNFSKAAAELAITQPAVSHGIRHLEAALGQPLFLRESRRLTLTPHGQRLFAAVSGGLAAISETVEEIVRTPRRQSVVIAASTIMATEWLLPRLSGLRAIHPDLVVDLRIVDHDPDLAAAGIGLHIRLGDGAWPGYETVQLWPETIAPICSPDYLAARGGVTDPAEILDHDLVHFVDPHRLRMGWAEWLRASGVAVPERIPFSLRSNDPLLALRACEAGHGIALGTSPTDERSLGEGRTLRVYPHAVSTGRHFYLVSLHNPGQRRHIASVCDWLIAEAGCA